MKRLSSTLTCIIVLFVVSGLRLNAQSITICGISNEGSIKDSSCFYQQITLKEDGEELPILSFFITYKVDDRFYTKMMKGSFIDKPTAYKLHFLPKGTAIYVGSINYMDKNFQKQVIDKDTKFIKDY